MTPRTATSAGRTRVLTALLHREAKGEPPPSFRTLADDTGLSLTTTYTHVKKLRKMGLVDFEDGRARTLHSTVAVVVGWQR